MRTIKISFILFFLLVSGQTCNAQELSSIEGKVIDFKTKEVLPFATVYLARTSIGMTANEKGEFKLEKIQSGKYDLSATMLGYNPFIRSIQFDGKSIEKFIIQLIANPAELDSVTVSARRIKNNFSGYSQFEKIFLGRTKNSYHCKILNREDIIAYKEENQLVAHAKKPIEIMNNALGYKIYYTLNEFTVDYKNDRLILLGNPRFEELKPENPKQEKKWKKERDRAYHGSAAHFLRSLKQRQLKENFFIVQNDAGKILNENDLVKDDLIQYKGTINIIFSKELPENIPTGNSALRTTARAGAAGQQSQIEFNGIPVKVYPNGYFEDVHNIVFLGYMGWNDQISDLVPLGYEPSHKLNSKK